MNKLIKVIAILVFTFIVTNQAFSWGISDLDPTNKNSGIRKGTRDIDPTNPNGSIGQDLHAVFVVCNRTDWIITYSVNNTTQILNRGNCQKWTSPGQSRVSFNNGIGEDKSYIVNDGNYSFHKFYFGSPNALNPTIIVDLSRD